MILYIYNPMNNVKRKVTIKRLTQLTGLKVFELNEYHSQQKLLPKINRFLIDDTYTIKELNGLMNKFEIEGEQWKPVNEKYQVSNMGRVRSYARGRNKLLMPYVKKNHKPLALYVKLTNEGKSKEVKVSWLVAKAFLDNPENHGNVMHIRRNVYDNRSTNLRWISKQEIGKLTGGLSKAMKVAKICKDTGEVLGTYDSMAEAGRDVGVNRESIRQAIKYNRKSGGFKWKLVEGKKK